MLYVDNYQPNQETASQWSGGYCFGATIFATKILHVRLFLTKGHVPHNTKGDIRVWLAGTRFFPGTQYLHLTLKENMSGNNQSNYCKAQYESPWE